MASPDIDMADQTEDMKDALMLTVNDGSDLADRGSPVLDSSTYDQAHVTVPDPFPDPLLGSHEWKVEGFTRLTEPKLYSESFMLGGYKWRLLIFPKGNKAEFLSLYLDVPDTELLPQNWQRAAGFKLSLIDQVDGKHTFVKDTSHTFTGRESDWGFTSFLPLAEVYNPAKNYIVDDAIVLRVEVNVRKTNLFQYDSRQSTGFVGLKNQGATCYMNSLLQTLYNINYFRQAVYHMPTTDEEAQKNIPLALQSLFYKMQFQQTSVSTKMLTKTFGWDNYESFMQHDVQELNRVLCEKLEDKMKGTKVEGVIQQLFEGNTWNYIECVNVDYKSTRTESFMDLQLDVKGCKDVYASFDQYCAVEMLEDQNQYKADGHGMQDARKGVLFESFPPVLQLQLKRFEYDFMRDVMVKINDRYEFPDELDLDVGNGKYLSPNADRKVRNRYRLHSVLVHSGGVHGGHYYAFIRPSGEQWYRFEDERVTKEDDKRALDEQFGEDDNATPGGFNNNLAFKVPKYSNAYMLVYIRVEDWDRIQCGVAEADIAEPLRVRLKAELLEKEQKRKEKQEAHLYSYMKIAREQDIKEQIGGEIFFDLVDHDKVKSIRVSKTITFADFKKEAAEELGVPPEKQRYWLWAKRQNHTFRPNRPMLPKDEELRVLDIKDNTTIKQATADVKLLLEPLQPNGELAKLDKNEILIFFKLYKPEEKELSYMGCRFAHKNDRINSLYQTMCQLAGWPVDTPLLVYEEIKYDPSVMCERISPHSTLSNAQLEHGDIICFQKAMPSEAEAALSHPTVKSFLDYVRNRQVVIFKPLESPKEEGLRLELSKENTYDEVCEAVTAELRCAGTTVPDSAHIRLTAHSCYSHGPKPSPMKYRSMDRLSDMLFHYNQMSDILYYEVLDMPLPQLEQLKSLKVALHNVKVEEVSQHQIRLPKESTVGEVLEVIAKEAGAEYSAADLRLVEVFYHKIFKIFSPSEKIDTINDQYWTLRAEVIPEEEKSLEASDKVIHVCHFSQDNSASTVVTNFGDPFFLLIREGETLEQIKPRIQAKLGVKDEEFAKWKVAFVPMSLRPEYLADSDEVATRFSGRPSYASGQDQNYLGLDHPDKHPKRNTQSSTYERPVKIYN